ncbi:MAG: hypothetical protein ACRDK9_14900 [Solirubrobacterales bacterium]
MAAIVSSRIRKPTVPAVPGSRRRKSAGAKQAASERARESPAEQNQGDHRGDPHRLAAAREEVAAPTEDHQHEGDQGGDQHRPAARSLRLGTVDLAAKADLPPDLRAALERVSRPTTAPEHRFAPLPARAESKHRVSAGVGADSGV